MWEACKQEGSKLFVQQHLVPSACFCHQPADFLQPFVENISKCPPWTRLTVNTCPVYFKILDAWNKRNNFGLVWNFLWIQVNWLSDGSSPSSTVILLAEGWPLYWVGGNLSVLFQTHWEVISISEPPSVWCSIFAIKLLKGLSWTASEKSKNVLANGLENKSYVRVRGGWGLKNRSTEGF